MVKFSDIEKDNLNPQKSQEKDRGLQGRPSGLSFRDFDKETRRTTSGEVVPPKKVNEEERKAIYDTATEYMTGVLKTIKKRQRFTLEPGEETVRRIINFKSPDDPLLIRAIYQDNPSGYLINHCVNVTIFSVKMAVALGLSKHEQEQIGLAALLHEVGMGVIPEQLIYKVEKLDEQEVAIFKKRPEFAYKILKGFGDDYSFLAETALQVHECMDGSGYPMGLRGDEIQLYPQIIGLVDMYEALIHSRPQRDKFPLFSAIKEIIKTGKQRYPKKLLKALLNIFSIFPMHSFVKLNSNAIGRVIQTYPDQPLRPKVEILFDSQGRKVLVKHVVDLSQNAILYIVDSVLEKDIKSMAEGPGPKLYSQTQAPAPNGLESAIIQDMDDSDGEAALGDDILEITEDDLDSLHSAAGKDVPGTDRSTFTVRPREVAKGEAELIDEKFVQLPETERGRRIRRIKWVLLAAGLVVFAAIALWRVGVMDFLSKNSDGPGTAVKTSVKKVVTVSQQKAKSDTAGSIVSKGGIKQTPADPVPSKSE